MASSTALVRRDAAAVAVNVPVERIAKLYRHLSLPERSTPATSSLPWAFWTMERKWAKALPALTASGVAINAGWVKIPAQCPDDSIELYTRTVSDFVPLVSVIVPRSWMVIDWKRVKKAERAKM